jgi:hypothetical protein
MSKVRVKVVYECGRCGNVQRREYVAQDGLLTVPNVYCGACVTGKRFTTMSVSISEAKVEETVKSPEVQGLERQPDMPAAGEVAGAVGGTSQGRQSADKTVDAKPAAGERSAGRVPGVPAKQGMPGKSAQ